MYKKHLTKLCFVFVVVLFLAFNIPIYANAAVKKISCSEYKNRTSSYVLKGGKSYKITKNGFDHGFLRFKATKTKTYTFLISDYKSISIKKSKDSGYGFIMAYKSKVLEDNTNSTDSDSMFWSSIKYGEDDIEGVQSVDFASEKYSNKQKEYAEKSAIRTDYPSGEEYFDEESADAYIRTYNEATLRLKKGEIIYLKFGNSVSDSIKLDKKNNKGFTCILKIK